MAPPGNSIAIPPLMRLSLRTKAEGYPAIEPSQFEGIGQGRVALVTGSGRGIGKAIATAFAQSGFNVAITARTKSQVDNTVAELQKSYPDVKVIGIPADGCKTEELQRLVEHVNEELGVIDVLVCNAGTNTFMPFTMTDPKDWWSSLEINLKAPTELTRIVLPQMRQRNSGTIIYTSSRAAVADLPWTTAYGAGKTGLTRFAACLQVELDQMQKIDYGHEKNGISLFSIHPGEVETDLHTTGFPEKTHKEAPYIIKHMNEIHARSPHYEASLPAYTCVFLTTDRASPLRGRYVDCTRDVEETIKAYTVSA
ncbi:NAD(P)-binding protein [Myriangium duriaei CBS 260.36]|uniref:NAD(P)-binding protein n=1 Tax=Myriangium duriaei CBS 260.36 TaxID=1168546 RepID=A0A9P4MFD3_9PEZI|nr:NAD(P)-binding protein [Myriangium duriaei CBS 260.36]